MLEQLENLEPFQLEQLIEEFKNLDVIMTKIDLHKESIKDSIATMSEEFEIPKKVLAKYLKTYHKSNFNNIKEEDDVFYALYEKLNGVEQ